MLPLQSTQACGRAGFCEKILWFSPAAQPKILGFFWWLSAKAPSMQACVLFHSRIFFLYIFVFLIKHTKMKTWIHLFPKSPAYLFYAFFNERWNETNVRTVGRRHKEKGETWVAAKSSVARFYRRGTQGVSFLFCRCWDPQAVHLFQDFSHEKNVKKSEKKA